MCCMFIIKSQPYVSVCPLLCYAMLCYTNVQLRDTVCNTNVSVASLLKVCWLQLFLMSFFICWVSWEQERHIMEKMSPVRSRKWWLEHYETIVDSTHLTDSTGRHLVDLKLLLQQLWVTVTERTSCKHEINIKCDKKIHSMFRKYEYDLLQW